MSDENVNEDSVFADATAKFPILLRQLVNDKINDTLIQKKVMDIDEGSKQVNHGQKTSETYLTPRKESTESVENNIIKIRQRDIQCPECYHYKCDTEEKLVRHIRSAHRGENPFQCTMCEYSTYNKVVFEEHVRIHQGIKPFKCSYCPYRSVSKKNTKKHELKHRPDNPLKCGKCNFIAQHCRGLLHHQKKHDPSLQSCEDCKFRYKTSEEYRLHRRNRRWCKECNEAFCSRPLLHSHMKKIHKIPFGLYKTPLFCCQHCQWSSNAKMKILLHLIHHPKQKVEGIDVEVLINCGIMVGE